MRQPSAPPGKVPAVPPVEALLPLRRLLRDLDRSAPPAATLACGAPLEDARFLVAVAGSFNPPHAAHLALLTGGLSALPPDALGCFLLSVRTVDKERVTGMLLEDRLWLLCRLLAELALPAAAVALNRGLYVEQAAALRVLCPRLEDLVFVVGYDKIVQIFDPRYYDDRDAALDDLFSASRFLVAPRDRFTAEDVGRLLRQPDNRRYADRVAVLPLDPALAGVSSSDARDLAERGAATAALLPPRVAGFVVAAGCYAPNPAAYARRAAALDALEA